MEQQRDAVAGAHAASREGGGDARGALVQLRVRALDAVEDERDAVRVRPRAALEQLRQVLRTVHALTPGAP